MHHWRRDNSHDLTLRHTCGSLEVLETHSDEHMWRCWWRGRSKRLSQAEWYKLWNTGSSRWECASSNTDRMERGATACGSTGKQTQRKQQRRPRKKMQQPNPTSGWSISKWSKGSSGGPTRPGRPDGGQRVGCGQPTNWRS